MKALVNHSSAGNPARSIGWAKNGTEKKRKRTKRKVWKRKINFRRKNFGNLDEWDPDPQMKKVDYTCFRKAQKVSG